MRWLRRAFALALLAGLCAVACMSTRAAGREQRPMNPLLSLQRMVAEPALVARVEQRLKAGSYSYLALRTDDGALHWAVTMGSAVPIGARVSVRSMGHKRDFHSRRLARTFPDLMFGVVSRVDEPGGE